MLRASVLFDVRRRAIRGRVWFRVLDSLERGILSLAAKILDVVRSVSLVSELAKIIAKIEDSLKGVFVRRLEGFGLSRAEALAAESVRLGNVVAAEWVVDSGFARYVTFMSLNMPIGWSV
jgi:hypothetical protein